MRKRQTWFRLAAIAAAAGVVTAVAAAPAYAGTASGVRRCAGGPSHYVGVHIVAAAPASEITAHNLLADGQGWSYFTGSGITNNRTFWTPYYQASWRVQSPSTLSGVSSLCYGGG